MSVAMPTTMGHGSSAEHAFGQEAVFDYSGGVLIKNENVRSCAVNPPRQTVLPERAIHYGSAAGPGRYPGYRRGCRLGNWQFALPRQVWQACVLSCLRYEPCFPWIARTRGARSHVTEGFWGGSPCFTTVTPHASKRASSVRKNASSVRPLALPRNTWNT